MDISNCRSFGPVPYSHIKETSTHSIEEEENKNITTIKPLSELALNKLKIVVNKLPFKEFIKIYCELIKYDISEELVSLFQPKFNQYYPIIYERYPHYLDIIRESSFSYVLEKPEIQYKNIIDAKKKFSNLKGKVIEDNI